LVYIFIEHASLHLPNIIFLQHQYLQFIQKVYFLQLKYQMAYKIDFL